MNEPVLKQYPTLSLDEFERRMREEPARVSARSDDPLAALARLVGEPHDPYDDMFAAGRGGVAAPAHAAQGYAAPGYTAEAPRLFGDFAAIEAGLRMGGSPAHQQDPHYAGYGHDASGHAEASFVQAGSLPFDAEGEWSGPAAGDMVAGAYADGRAEGRGERLERRGMRRPMMLMAASIAVGVLGIGAAFALKGRVASSPREIKTIMADTTPTRIQPPPEAAGEGGVDTTIGKGGAQPTKLVSREEQPVDLGQAVQDNVARAALAARSTDAASVPVPPAPGQMQTGQAQPAQAPGRADPIGAQVQGFAMGEMPTPKRVKVMRLKPDDTPVPAEDAITSRAPQGEPVKAKAATPKAAASKSTSRVAAAPAEDKTIEQVAEDDAKPARKQKPQRVAAAELQDAPADAAAPESGSFAVQLAAPASEADAKAARSRFSKKFSDALSGRTIAIRKAESNGRSVYRVRVSSLSRNEATSLCDKLKADGGSCYVAKN